MPRMCECPRCVKFREKNPPTITNASRRALEKTNQPHSKSRSALIKAGVGKRGTLPAKESDD